MQTTSNDVERFTISLPHATACAVDSLRTQLKVSRSELFKLAVEHFIEEQRSSRLQTIAAEMAEEYRANRDLTALTALDCEDFA